MEQHTNDRIKRLESATDALVGTILDYLALDVQIIELHKKVYEKEDDVDVELIRSMIVRRLELNAHATGVLQSINHEQESKSSVQCCSCRAV